MEEGLMTNGRCGRRFQVTLPRAIYDIGILLLDNLKA